MESLTKLRFNLRNDNYDGNMAIFMAKMSHNKLLEELDIMIHTLNEKKNELEKSLEEYNALDIEHKILLQNLKALKDYPLNIDTVLNARTFNDIKKHILNELKQKTDMIEQIKEFEYKRDQIHNLTEIKRQSWNILKQNFKGLCQSCTVFMPSLGTTIEKIREEI